MLPPPRAIALFLCWLLLLLTCVGAANPPDFPSEIRLNGAVLHSPPFAYIEKDAITGNDTYSGFMIDLLDRLKIFAAQDNVDLHVDLTTAPEFYSDAFDLVSSACNNRTAKGKCQELDLIVGDFYANPERSMLADLSPSWLRSTTTTLKYLEKDEGDPDYTTLKEAEDAQATVCVPQGTFMEQFAWSKFPRGNYLGCEPNNGECVKFLKQGNCVLFVYDELILHHIASNDYAVSVTREQFNTQYMVWPMRPDLPPLVSRLMKKWLYRAIQNNTVDDLYFQYFQNQLCPQGTAGKNCEKPCDPDNGVANARGECVCKSKKYEGEDCSIEVPEELNLLPRSLVIMCYALVSFSFLVVILFVTWFVINRRRAQVRITQPSFLMLILLGCVISTSTIIALAQEDRGDGPVHACMAIPWLYSVGFCLTFGAMFARIRHIYHVLRYAAELTHVTVSAKETAITVGMVMVIDVAILTIWTIVDPLEWVRVTTSADVFGDPLVSEGYCHSEHWSVFAGIIGLYHLLLMGTACYMTYIARNCPNRIANLKYVGIAMFSNMQIFLMVVPVLLVVGSDPQTSFLIRSLAIWINDVVVVGLIFGNFIYRVYQFDRKNRDMSSRNLSVVASRVALRAGIVAFAKESQPDATPLKNRPSLYSNELKPGSKRGSAVRFSADVKQDPLQALQQDSWTRRVSQEFDTIEQAVLERRTTEATTAMSLVESEVQGDSGEIQEIQTDVRVAQNPCNDSVLCNGPPPETLWPPLEASSQGSKEHERGNKSLRLSGVTEEETDGDEQQSNSNDLADATLERPDFRRHRSHSEPSLTALKHKNKSKAGHRLDPSMPQDRFLELVYATFGQRAQATHSDLPPERFTELLAETYGTPSTTRTEVPDGAASREANAPDESGAEKTETSPMIPAKEAARAAPDTLVFLPRHPPGQKKPHSAKRELDEKKNESADGDASSPPMEGEDEAT